MLKRTTNIVCLADETRLDVFALSAGGLNNTLASLSVMDVVGDDPEAVALPAAVRRSVNRVLVVPDYWVGNRFYEFQSRKQSIAAAFVERKLKQDHPGIDEVDDYYHFEMLRGDQESLIYTCYLQEAIAFRLYRRLVERGGGPGCITTPAMIWQARLASAIDRFDEGRIGFVHLDDQNAFLYFYSMGRFLFSRTIPLGGENDGGTDVFEVLNYEINQSFYLFSQKARHAVERLYLLASDPSAANRLSELLGQEVHRFPGADESSAAGIQGLAFPACRAFGSSDFLAKGLPSICHKPLARELAWRPVQMAGILVGAILLLLLTLESVWLWDWSTRLDEEVGTLRSASVEPPEMVIDEFRHVLADITRDMGRPKGGATLMQAMLAGAGAVSIERLVLDTEGTSRLSVEATVAADDPATFRTVLQDFIAQLNQRLNLETRPLREQDVRITHRQERDTSRASAYQILFDIEVR